MALVNSYATRAELKADLGITDTADDAKIDRVLGDVSRWIEEYTGRWFLPRTQTRYFTARRGRELLVDDLLAVTTLKTDLDGDRTYEDTWTATDYDLEPYNAANETPPEPYTRIGVTPDGDYLFPSGTAKGVEVAGRWGYYDQRSTSSATLSEDLDTTETAVDVSDGTQFSPGHTILIDSEQMSVTAVSANTLSVRRGANGTTAAIHTSGASIQVYEFPVVNSACLLQAARLLRRKDAPFGISGAPEIGQATVIARLDPDVRVLLSAFRRLVFA